MIEELAREMAKVPLSGRADVAWDDLDPLMQAYYRGLAEIAINYVRGRP